MLRRFAYGLLALSAYFAALAIWSAPTDTTFYRIALLVLALIVWVALAWALRPEEKKAS